VEIMGLFSQTNIALTAKCQAEPLIPPVIGLAAAT